MQIRLHSYFLVQCPTKPTMFSVRAHNERGREAKSFIQESKPVPVQSAIVPASEPITVDDLITKTPRSYILLHEDGMNTSICSQLP